MPATQTQLRRGTSTQCDAMTPAAGELIVDTTNNRPRLGDGSTLGGMPIPSAQDIQSGMFNTVSATGTDTIAVTLSPVPANYFTNMTIVFKAAATNTGAATLNVNSLGVKNIYKVSGGALGALSSGDLVIGAYYTVRYDGTQFVLEGTTGGVTSITAADTSLTITPTTGSATAAINTNNSLGVGATAMLRYGSGSLLANGSTTSGSNLKTITFNTSDTGGVITANVGSTLSGTWRNISGESLRTNLPQNVGFFIRTA